MVSLTKRLRIPKSIKTGNDTVIETETSIVIIGANGSGKSSLGARLDSLSQETYRISAQKSLTMPVSVGSIALDMAEKDLLYGDPHMPDGHWEEYKSNFRWAFNPLTHLLDDFQKLLVYLFSEEHKISTQYRKDAASTKKRIQPPPTKLDTVKRIWETVLPHRKLIISDGGKVEVYMVNQPTARHSGTMMSDGERAIFYLIGQSLAAPKDGTVIIDEPEQHIHKSVQIMLWNEIEKARPDCLFVYLTHDVDFAAAKSGSTKIWLKSFDGTNWEWKEIEVAETLPEELVVQILGNRRPVLFVEGENGSYDVELFRLLYPSHLVIPRGSCTQVIALTKAFKSQFQFHHLDICGIIDRDRRTEAEVKALEKNGISVLDVAEVENLFCVPEILELVAKQLVLEEKISEAREFVLKCLKTELEDQIALRAANEVKFQLARLDDKSRDEKALSEAVEQLVKSIDVSKIYSTARTEFDKVISANDHIGVLRLYNCKSLASRTGAIFGLKKNELVELVLRMAKSKESESVKNAFKKYVPQL